MERSTLELLDLVRDMSASQISEVAMAVVERYRLLFPEWEIVLYSYPKEDEAMRKLFLSSILAQLEQDR